MADANGGLFYYLYQGVKLGIYPPLIFMGVGAMTDFAPLIANPKSLLLGAAAQLGIFIAFILARLLGFTSAEASSIGIIGGADGPTAIFVTTKLAPHLLGAIAVAAYSYMALVDVYKRQGGGGSVPATPSAAADIRSSPALRQSAPLWIPKRPHTRPVWRRS